MFLCKSQSGQRAALKRMFVNEEDALQCCKQEIDILVSNKQPCTASSINAS